MTSDHSVQQSGSGNAGAPVHELLDAIEPLVGWSIGSLRIPGMPPRMPKQCLEHCLNGDPASAKSEGCAWLQAMVSGDTAPSLPHGGRCEQRFQIHVLPLSTRDSEDYRVFALRDDESGGGATFASPHRPDSSPPEWPHVSSEGDWLGYGFLYLGRDFSGEDPAGQKER